MNYTGFVKVISKPSGLVFLTVDGINNDDNVYLYVVKNKASRVYIGTTEIELSNEYKDKSIELWKER